jgi:mono/diheme cytochrome c family protein
MKLVRLGLLMVLVALITLACEKPNSGASTSPTPAAATPSASPTPTVDEFAGARANYGKHCSNCHGDEAKGGIVKVENKRLKVPSLRAGHALKHSDEEYIKQITKGGDGMPPFKDKLSEAEISDLIRFIHHDFQGKTQ